MRPCGPEFACLEPAVRRQEDEGQYERAQNVVLPCAAPIGPEKKLLESSQKVTHCPNYTEVSDERPEVSTLPLLTHMSEQYAAGRIYDPAVAHLYNASAHGRRLRVVRNHDDGLIEAVVQLLKHVKDEG